jgi:hypothetical protein
MKKLFIFLIVSVSAFAIDFDVMPVSADIVFNYYFTICVEWSFLLAGFFAALALFRL